MSKYDYDKFLQDNETAIMKAFMDAVIYNEGLIYLKWDKRQDKVKAEHIEYINDKGETPNDGPN